MNPRMLYSTVLGIPADVEEPTKYQLLGIGPEEATPERVAKALEERRLKAKQSVRDPRLIPAVLMLEKELQEAAATLGDPKLRAAYDAQIGSAPSGAVPTAADRKAQLRNFVREQARELSEPDGTMTAENKEELSRRLAGKGLSQKSVDHVLNQIPDAVEGEAPNAAATMSFFEDAIDMVIRKGPLSDEDRLRFIEMGKSFGLSEEKALAVIEAKAAGQASAGAQPQEAAPPEAPGETVESAPPGPTHEELLDRFEAKVRDLCPSGRPADNQQKLDVTRAMKECGVSLDEARSVLRKVRAKAEATREAPSAEPAQAPPEPNAEAAEPEAEPEAPAEEAAEPRAETRAPAEPTPEAPVPPAKEESAALPTLQPAEPVSPPVPESEAAPKKRRHIAKIGRRRLKWEQIIPIIVIIIFALVIWLFGKIFD